MMSKDRKNEAPAFPSLAIHFVHALDCKRERLASPVRLMHGHFQIPHIAIQSVEAQLESFCDFGLDMRV